MASPFVSRTPAELSKEQRKEKRLAWKPNSVRLKAQKPSAVTVVFRSEKAVQERAAV